MLVSNAVFANLGRVLRGVPLRLRPIKGERAMKPSVMFCVAAMTVATASQSVFAQADAKAKGNAYNFWQSMGWQQQAHSQARSLYYYGQTQQPTPAQAKEHATAARQGIEKAQKGLAELKKDNSDNKEAQEAIAKIEQIQKKILGHCDMMDKALAKADFVEMCSCCSDIQDQVEAANAEMAKLQKALKIEDHAPKKK
jgi:hypothetical protein